MKSTRSIFALLVASLIGCGDNGASAPVGNGEHEDPPAKQANKEQADKPGATESKDLVITVDDRGLVIGDQVLVLPKSHAELFEKALGRPDWTGQGGPYRLYNNDRYGIRYQAYATDMIVDNVGVYFDLTDTRMRRPPAPFAGTVKIAGHEITAQSTADQLKEALGDDLRGDVGPTHVSAYFVDGKLRNLSLSRSLD